MSRLRRKNERKQTSQSGQKSRPRRPRREQMHSVRHQESQIGGREREGSKVNLPVFVIPSAAPLSLRFRIVDLGRHHTLHTGICSWRRVPLVSLTNKDTDLRRHCQEASFHSVNTSVLLISMKDFFLYL